MVNPIITRDKTLRQVEIKGELRWVAETVSMDYGKQGTTRVYILATDGAAADDAANRANLNRVLNRLGYRLKQ